MKNPGLLFLIILIIVFSCEKKETNLSGNSITYKVVENSSANPVYSVMYTGPNAISITEGGLTEEKWEKTVKNLKTGSFISFTLESATLSGNFKVSIYNGSTLLLEDNMGGQYSPLTWEGTIP